MYCDKTLITYKKNMPVIHFLYKLYVKALHFVFGCKSFYFYRFNNNGTPYIRTCICCGYRESYKKGIWRKSK